MTKKEKWVAFREEQKLIKLIDSVVDIKGIDRSDFIREAIRKRLAELSFFSDESKKALEVPQSSKKTELKHQKEVKY
jgi:metal-responsive CopG/Arc/MetJ family transcriptional regulator